MNRYSENRPRVVWVDTEYTSGGFNYCAYTWANTSHYPRVREVLFRTPWIKFEGMRSSDGVSLVDEDAPNKAMAYAEAWALMNEAKVVDFHERG